MLITFFIFCLLTEAATPIIAALPLTPVIFFVLRLLAFLRTLNAIQIFEFI